MPRVVPLNVFRVVLQLQSDDIQYLYEEKKIHENREKDELVCAHTVSVALFPGIHHLNAHAEEMRKLGVPYQMARR